MLTHDGYHDRPVKANGRTIGYIRTLFHGDTSVGSFFYMKKVIPRGACANLGINARYLLFSPLRDE